MLNPFFVYFFLTLAATCSDPQHPDNGRIIRLSGQSPGDYAEFRCNIGFELQGSNIITCLKDGDWSRLPKCVPSTGGTVKAVPRKWNYRNALPPSMCQEPPAIANGDFSYTSNEIGALATYTCRQGYRPIGNAVVSCQPDGYWSEAPMCRKVVCYGPPAVANADVLRLTGYSLGSQATYRCKSHYQLVGNPTVTCQEDGNWTPMPSCVGKCLKQSN